MPRGRWGHEGWPGTISLPCRSMADSPLRAQRKSCYLAEGIEETTALVAAERDHDLLVYYFIVVHQTAEPGREADVARGGTDRPTGCWMLDVGSKQVVVVERYCTSIPYYF
jgi:hypothetical protein